MGAGAIAARRGGLGKLAAGVGGSGKCECAGEECEIEKDPDGEALNAAEDR